MNRAPAVVSIHDVTPETLSRVETLVEVLLPVTGTALSLLVVPGLPWSPGQLDTLRGWAAKGVEMAGHGWIHEGPPRTLYHRLHGWVLSRDQAEHLSRPRSELVALVERGFKWFAAVGLPAPELYTPPAWALGRLRKADLARLPYRWYEVLTGFVEAGSGRLLPTPLVGFEADTAFREGALTLLNGFNRMVAERTGRPLRIGVHPRDLELRLAHRVLAMVEGCDRHLTTAEAVALLQG